MSENLAEQRWATEWKYFIAAKISHAVKPVCIWVALVFMFDAIGELTVAVAISSLNAVVILFYVVPTLHRLRELRFLDGIDDAES